ncbi:HAD-IB family phosphatase [Candidatus Uhrbacteria bacterium]|nr:HAD-IB family phosphatase [Candidatus Uhrbacteria bacterium]
MVRPAVRPTPERIERLKRRMIRRVATFFDIDGTISKEQLLIVFMLTGGYLSPSRNRILRPLYKAIETYTTKRTYDYRPVIDAAVRVAPRFFRGLRTDDAAAIARSVVARFGPMTYIFPRTLLETLRKMPLAERGLIVGITGAPDVVAEAYGEAHGFDLVYSAIYAHEKGRYTGEVDKRSIHRKGDIIDELAETFRLDLKESIALGDSETDIPMLKRVGYPFAVNPQDTLLKWSRLEGDAVWANDRQKNGVTFFRKDGIGSFEEVDANKIFPDHIPTLNLQGPRR